MNAQGVSLEIPTASQESTANSNCMTHWHGKITKTMIETEKHYTSLEIPTASQESTANSYFMTHWQGKISKTMIETEKHYPQKITW